MKNSRLDTSPLAAAIAQLKDSLHFCQEDMVKENEKLTILLRAATIQAFEFTYELSCKMLKRYLEMSSSDPQEIEVMSFPNLIRTGCEQGLLLSDISQWKKYRHDRSITSHTYDQKKALEVFENIPFFLEEAEYLLNKLNERIGGL